MPYANFAALAAAEVLGTDYRIRLINRASAVVAMAIHGGGIEGGTSDVAEAVAGIKFSLYQFEGIKPSGNSALHIESTDFDEPSLLWLLNQSQRVVALHGTSGTSEATFVGGLDTLVRDRVIHSLTQAGFVASIATGDIAGTEANNVTNLGTSQAGIQVEMTTALRATFFTTNTAAGRPVTRTPLFYAYVDALLSGINVTSIEQGF